MSTQGDTDKFLAVRWPHLDKQLLDEMNEGIACYKQKNGGTVEAVVRWTKGKFRRLAWTICKHYNN